MSDKNIIHILSDSPISSKTILCIKQHFTDKHLFISTSRSHQFLKDKNVIKININNPFAILKLIYHLSKAKKIILHSLFDATVVNILFLRQSLLKKCYFAMWGSDFYFPEKQRYAQRKVIKKMGNFITYIKGDYQYVKREYGATGKYHDCLMYYSNTYTHYELSAKKSETTNILVGNSASITNNNLSVLEKLYPYKDQDIKIFMPLSYGNKDYANKLTKKGRAMFGDKFKALTNFLPFQDYIAFLGTIDIAIFAQNRQQAMGNIITLLGLGKKVYIRNNTTPWALFQDIGVSTYHLDTLDLSLIDPLTKEKNQEKIRSYFSKERLLKQLKKLIEE